MTGLVTDGLRWWANVSPDRPAIIFDGQDTVDYGELDRWTDNAARFLGEFGLRQGDRIGIIGANSLEWCVAAIGALKLGAVAVPYNDRFVADELSYLVSDSAPSLILTDEDSSSRMTEALTGEGIDLVALSEFTHLRESKHVPVPDPDVQQDDIAVIVYTSGTTSKPKGVIFTHRSTLSFISEFGFMEPVLAPGARMIYLLSMAGAPGLLWHILHPLTRGVTLYYERSFDPRAALQRLTEERIQVMVGVPVLFEQVATLPEFVEADLSALELAIISGARAPVETIKAWLYKGAPLRQAYGMTELGGVSTLNPADQALSRPESIGKGSMFTRHRVVRPDGTDCSADEPGEIVVSGPSVTPGYWRNEDATADALRGGWFHTGDVGLMDEQGFIRMVDRLKDLIISGGFNIAPSEIEGTITAIRGVQEVCVIATEDEKFGEAPAAIVYTEQALSEDELIEHCAGKLAKYKVPRVVMFADGPLPRMASGKIARKDVRAMFRKVVSGGEPAA